MAKAIILNELITELGLNVSSFEREIKVGASTISKAISRKSEIKLDVVEKILDAFPEVSKKWLLTGEGLLSEVVRFLMKENEEKTEIIKRLTMMK